jgi:hypothetical protein
MVLVFISKEGFGFWVFAADQDVQPIADQREALAPTDYAVRFGWTSCKSLRLARCIASAASVSD